LKRQSRIEDVADVKESHLETAAGAVERPCQDSSVSFTPSFSLGISARVDLGNRFNGFRNRFEIPVIRVSSGKPLKTVLDPFEALHPQAKARGE
jgi:hypothetical protein